MGIIRTINKKMERIILSKFKFYKNSIKTEWYMSREHWARKNRLSPVHIPASILLLDTWCTNENDEKETSNIYKDTHERSKKKYKKEREEKIKEEKK